MRDVAFQSIVSNGAEVAPAARSERAPLAGGGARSVASESLDRRTPYSNPFMSDSLGGLVQKPAPVWPDRGDGAPWLATGPLLQGSTLSAVVTGASSADDVSTQSTAAGALKEHQASDASASARTASHGMLASAGDALSLEPSSASRGAAAHGGYGAYDGSAPLPGVLGAILRDAARLLFRGHERRAAAIAVALAAFNQLSASTSIINYAPEVLSRVGVHGHERALELSALVAAGKALGVGVGVPLCVGALTDAVCVWPRLRLRYLPESHGRSCPACSCWCAMCIPMYISQTL
jgi:hypothetical protein